MTLTELETRILNFEAGYTTHSGTKELAIVDELHIRPARYYQLLTRIIDNPAALEADPVLVNRLLRIRDTNTAEQHRRHRHH